jgi:hypothetical protein
VFSSNTLLAESYRKFPRDIEELVRTSDLIVIGTTGEIIDQRMFYGYQNGADALAQKEQETPFSLGLPLVDYAIHIQEIIMNDKEYPLADINDIVIYRTFEDQEITTSADAIKDREGKIMFFLTRNPDNETYGITSMMHRIKLGDGHNNVSYTFKGENMQIPFAPSATSDEFTKEVKNYVESILYK